MDMGEGYGIESEKEKNKHFSRTTCGQPTLNIRKNTHTESGIQTHAASL